MTITDSATHWLDQIFIPKRCLMCLMLSLSKRKPFQMSMINSSLILSHAELWEQEKSPLCQAYEAAL